MEAELAGFILWGIKTIFHLFQKKNENYKLSLNKVSKSSQFLRILRGLRW